MGSKKDIVELNGKQYDVRTGEIIGSTTATPKIRPANVEGFLQQPTTHAPLRAPVQPLRRTPKRPHTLMRHVVAKPKVETSSTNEKPQLITSQLRTLSDFRRQKRAQNLPKSQSIKKFGNPQSPQNVQTGVTKKAQQAQKNSQPAPVSRQENRRDTRPADNPFERAMHQAHSHEEKRPKRLRTHHRLAQKFHVSPRFVSATTLIAAFLLLGGFFAYQNVANLEVRYAAMRANVDGKLPSYKPGGFSLRRPIQYSAGQISLSYHSTSDDRTFKVTQRTSSWDSATLLNEYVASNKLVQTVDDNGKTIYVYGENNATWVDNGVWYQVDSNASLSSDQLLRIARSL